MSKIPQRVFNNTIFIATENKRDRYCAIAFDDDFKGYQVLDTFELMSEAKLVVLRLRIKQKELIEKNIYVFRTNVVCSIERLFTDAA